jgi:hypothetical protein
MVLRRGEGYSEGTKLVVTNFDEQQRIRIISQQVSFRAEDMPFMAWTFSKFSPRTSVWVAWITKQDPQHLNMMPALLPLDATAVYRMKENPEWKGDIVALGFGFDGQMYDSFSLDSVEIRPYSIGSMLESMWDEWSTFEGWSHSSINGTVGGSNRALIRPTHLVLTWLVLMSVIYLSLSYRKNNNSYLRVLPIFFISGWMVLDVRWQVDLFRQNYLTYQLYMGKTLDEKRLIGKDRRLYVFAQEIKKRLPDEEVRVFLTGKGIFGNIIYEQPRLQYFLMPYNGSYFENHYAPYSNSLDSYGYLFNVGAYVDVGEYISVLGEDNRVQFNEETKVMIIGGKYRFKAERLFESVDGALYKTNKKLENILQS